MLRTLTNTAPSALEDLQREKQLRRTSEVFLLFALGSQFDHLIKMQLEKLGVFCLVADPSTIRAADVLAVNPTGIIISGGPASIPSEPPDFDAGIFDLGLPLLGICLGYQMWASHIGAAVLPGAHAEYSTHQLTLAKPSRLFNGVPGNSPVLESHGDAIETLPGLLDVLAVTEHAPAAAGNYRHLWGVQFHPEVTETTFGPQIFENFCFGICGARDRFPADDVAQHKIAELYRAIGGRTVLLALSGGSDSSVVAYLLKQALTGRPEQLQAIYIEGCDRLDDRRHVEEFFGQQEWLNLNFADATDRLLESVRGLADAPAKRCAMREVYRGILEDRARRAGAAFIAQGTLYTDISESGGGYITGARKAQIKLHHNVGLTLSLPELTPLADQVKDTARHIGRAVGVPEELLTRHPFPGPGLLIRIEGAVTREKLRLARLVDNIFIAELRHWDLYDSIWQACADVTASVTTWSKGDDAGTGCVIELKAYWSVNGFTAQAAELPHEFIKHVSRRITNEVPHVGGVCYNYSDKPPRTIERG